MVTRAPSVIPAISSRSRNQWRPCYMPRRWSHYTFLVSHSMQAVDPTLFFCPEIGLHMLRNDNYRRVNSWLGLMHPLAMVVTGQCGREIVPAELIKCPGISRRISLPHELLKGITQLAYTLALSVAAWI